MVGKTPEAGGRGESTRHNLGIDVHVEPDGKDDHDLDPHKRTYGVGELFAPRQRARTLLVSVCAFVQQLQYYGVGFYVPVIVGLIFGTDVVSTIIATMCTQALALAAGLFGVRMTSKLGLRKLGLTGYAVVLVCLLAVATIGIGGDDLSLLPVVLVAFMLAGTSFGPGPLSKTLAAVVYPTEIRGLGTGWAESMGRLGSIVGLFFFPVLLAALGAKITMLVIAVFPLIAIVTLATTSLKTERAMRSDSALIFVGSRP